MAGASALHALSMRRASAATAMATAATTAASAISSQALRRRRGLFPGTLVMRDAPVVDQKKVTQMESVTFSQCSSGGWLAGGEILTE